MFLDVNNTMDIYLIDYENVNNNGLTGIELIKSSEVHIFYSESSNKSSPQIKYTFKEVEALQKANVKIYFHETNKGKNSLDFQLCSYLGFQIAQIQPQEKTNFLLYLKTMDISV